MRRVVLALAGAAAAVPAGWAVFVRVQGDSLLVFEPEALAGVAVAADGRSVRGEVTIVNRGKVGGVVHKVDGRVVSGPPGRVLVTRKGTRPPEPGWWQSNCLLPGESCVAEVEVVLEAPAEGPVVVELDAHEIGRRLKVHRTVQAALAPGAGVAAADPPTQAATPGPDGSAFR